ncbi:MAG: oligosaccharide flippase family protein [Thermoleophilaceae bacterium]|nr:oligosaccharide flippase family protein [Thermoleophilaceae bacterium]
MPVTDQEPPQTTTSDRRRGRQGSGLRVTTARGTLINAAFLVAFDSLGIIRGFIVAAFLTTAEYGIWGILVATVGMLGLLKTVGVSDKYIQQEDNDQERAFQEAFTIEAILNVAVLAILLLTLPLVAVIYGQPEIVAPGLVIALGIPAVTLQAPIWVFYRRMEFVRQRTLQSFEPIVGFAVTIGMAIGGFGYWALVIGFIAGSYAGALAAVLASPYRLAFRLRREVLRDYFGFSWPLLITSLSAIAYAQVSIFMGQALLGLAGAGIIALAASITLYANKVSSVITGTLYPAICAVRDRTDLLFESFVKSNRLALLWGTPFGLGLALFAHDLISFVIGDKWLAAVGLIQVFGVIAAINQIGFNWTAFYQARSDTRPMAILSIVSVIAFAATVVPLTLTDGLRGFGIGMALTTLVALIGRIYYLTRLFEGFRLLPYVTRALGPSVLAVAAVLLLRGTEGTDRTPGHAMLELLVYLVVTAIATWLVERELLREVLGYMRRRPVTPVTD